MRVKLAEQKRQNCNSKNVVKVLANHPVGWDGQDVCDGWNGVAATNIFIRLLPFMRNRTKATKSGKAPPV